MNLYPAEEQRGEEYGEEDGGEAQEVDDERAALLFLAVAAGAVPAVRVVVMLVIVAVVAGAEGGRRLGIAAVTVGHHTCLTHSDFGSTKEPFSRVDFRKRRHFTSGHNTNTAPPKHPRDN